ncbi:MAG: AAA family ATPase, partial [Clostridia bacterium]
MKPIHLQIAGLHSYREQVEIDFETLCAAGLFGIFGPTGSGKSTILDAITLALYGQVVRTGGGSHPQESLNQHEQRLFVSFTFELGHHARRKRYTIEREFGLDKKGKKRQPEVRLIERATAEGEEDHVLESRATSATQAVEQLLGLTLSDFTRAVVLPQGQFSKFLTLKGSERNEMLQRIFHLHEYGEKLNERIRATVEMNKESLHRTEKELAGLGDAGPDALAQAAEELQQALDLEQNYSAQRLVLQERKEELEQIRSWQSEWQQIELQLAQLEERKQEIEAMEEQCRFIEAAIRIWPQLEKVNQLAQEHEQWTQRLELLRVKREATLQEQQRCEQVFQQSQTDMRSEEPRLLEQKGKLAEAIEWEQELAQLHTELSGWVNALQALETEQMSLSLKLTQKREELVGWQQMREALESESKASVVTPEERKKVVALRDRKLAWERELAQMQQLKQEADEAEEQGKKHTLLVRQQLEQYQKEAQLREQMAATLTDLQAKPVIGEQALL